MTYHAPAPGTLHLDSRHILGNGVLGPGTLLLQLRKLFFPACLQPLERIGVILQHHRYNTRNTIPKQQQRKNLRPRYTRIIIPHQQQKYNNNNNNNSVPDWEVRP